MYIFFEGAGASNEIMREQIENLKRNVKEKALSYKVLIILLFFYFLFFFNNNLESKNCH
jgi:uncharacterized membrane protein (DUF106 family)